MRINSFGFSLAGLLGFSATAAAQNTDPMAGHAAVQMQRDTSITALLTGPLGTRSPAGTVTVNGTAVRVTWADDQPGSTRSWYVHKGSCNRDEGMVGAPGAYGPIAVDARGTGSGTATLDAPLAGSGSYFVAVHAGASGATPGIIACGPLSGGELRGDRAGGPPLGPQTGSQMGNMPGMRSSRDSGQMAGYSMPGMDHSTMNMPGMQPARGNERMSIDHSRMEHTPRAASSGADSVSSLMMAMHMRMMADPVIRQRVTADPAMRRMMEGMMAQMPAEHGAMMMPRKAPGSSPTPKRSTTKPTPVRKPAAPATKKDAMPGMDHGTMKGMDHSKMPDMGKP